MLEHVDRVQFAVRDRTLAAKTLAAAFGAMQVGDDAVAALGAKRTTVQAGTSEFELLEPAGGGPVAEYLEAWGEGLFAAGFSTNDIDALARRLDAHSVAHTDEGEQLFIAPDQTPGLRMVISRERDREMVGRIRYLYEATNLIDDHESAGRFYAEAFGLDPSRFVQIASREYGYVGQLTMFDPPGRLDRIELSQISDWQRPMGRFMKRRGGQTLYMCYVETDDVGAIARACDAASIRYAGRDPESPFPEGIFLHPSTMHGALVGCSRTNLAWTWSGRPELAGREATAH